MPRRPRLEAPGAVHHVVVQAASDGRIVADDADRLRFLDELRAVVNECGWLCAAYCVMESHVASRRYREIVDDAVARLCRRRAAEAWWRTVERAAAETRATG